MPAKITRVAGCSVEPKPIVPSAEKCIHTPCPESYMAWHAWADIVGRKYSQIRCPHCGLYAIWLTKRQAAAIRKRQEKDYSLLLKAIETATK